MSTDFLMPALGADMTDGVITEWLVQPGDEVRRGQIVVVVETDKSDIEVEVFEDAVVETLLVPAGERVAVGTPIARMRPAGELEGPPPTGADLRDRDVTVEEPPADQPPLQQRVTDGAPDSTPAAPPVTAPAAPPVTAPAAPPVTAPAATSVTSPLVRHLADELHVDVSRVRGSGAGGRIHRDDVIAAGSRPDAGPPVTPRARMLAAELGVDLADVVPTGDVVTGEDVIAHGRRRPATSVGDPRRRVVASLMSTSWAEIPHYHVSRRVELGPALERLRAANEQRPVGERILPAALMLHAVARAACAVPELNGWWIDGAFQPSEHVDLGVVISLRRGGIIVPTMARAEERSVPELMSALSGLAQRARSNALRSSDVTRASLTVTNLGDLGADAVYGVIHPPQVALVGLGAIHDEPWAADGMVGVRPVVHATLSGDHRAADGLVGATFLAKFAAALRDIDPSDLQPPKETT